MTSLPPQNIYRIKLKNLRDFIIEKSLGTEDAIFLNQYDFDALAEEHREVYGSALAEPYFIINTLIAEDNEVPRGKIVIGKNSIGEPGLPKVNLLALDYSNETVYRCGWCGNVVDYDGSELKPPMRTHKIILLERHIREITTQYVNGYCCSIG